MRVIQYLESDGMDLGLFGAFICKIQLELPNWIRIQPVSAIYEKTEFVIS